MKTRDYTRPKPEPLSWDPVLRGDIYCAPACGYKCTKAAYDKSVADADALVNRLGPGWKPRVWENGGWHYQALTVDERMSVGPCSSGYHAFLNEAGRLPAGRWAEDGKTPEAAVKNVLKTARMHLEWVREVIEGVEATIGRGRTKEPVGRGRTKEPVGRSRAKRRPA